MRGAWITKNSASWNVKLDARGSLSGIWETGFNLVVFGLAEPSRWDGYNDALVLEGSGNFNVNWRVDTTYGYQRTVTMYMRNGKIAFVNDRGAIRYAKSIK
ncbi:hypothetical protein vBKpnAMK5_00294 [Klebsiella phage vB_Kpn_AM_K5]